MPILSQEFGQDYEIILPEMPNPESPNCEEWIVQLSRVVEPFTGNVHLVGHSLGGSVLLQYMARYNKTLRRVHIVAAPFWCGQDHNWQIKSFALTNEEIDVLQSQNLIFYHGTEDETVPYSHLKEYEESFSSATIRSYTGMNHVDPSETFLKDLALDIKLIRDAQVTRHRIASTED